MNLLSHLQRGLSSFASEFLPRVSMKRDKAPIGSVERVCHFAMTRSAFVTQKKLFGYVKERMGMTYAKAFQRDDMAQSLTIATYEIYAACLADLTVYCVAQATASAEFANEDRVAIARRAFREGLLANTSPGKGAEKRDSWTSAFEQRLASTVWFPAGEGEYYFTQSGPALVYWSPIADELKNRDEEIVLNSIRFAWVDVRTDYLERLDRDSVLADWNRKA